MASQTSDHPVVNPQDDLLGMTPYAENRAAYLSAVPLPFTLGVYGRWGEGKTSFVHLLVHSLRHQPSWHNLEFIDFSAWPYTTTDAVWRALTLEIARTLYKPSSRGAADEAVLRDNSRGLLPSLRRLLHQDAILIRATETPPSPDDEYRQVVSRLDRSAAAIATRSARTTEVGLDYSLIAFLKLLSGLAGSLSPGLGGLRKVLGPESPMEFAQRLETARTAAARESVEYVEDLRSVIRGMFEDRGRGRRLVIFVDDLDRCMPEVTLELLECLKIFFTEAPCLFIVAADEALIGAGLRARFRSSDGSSVLDESALARQGQEYFEKILQLAVRLPEKAPSSIHCFVARQFPAWTCATDILQIAIGSNPRRLKQQCVRLDYEFSVAQIGQAAGLGPLLEKLVCLHLVSPELLAQVRSATEDPGDFIRYIEEIESRCREIEGGRGNRIATSVSLRDQPCEALLAAPLLSQTAAADVALVAGFADVHPAYDGRRFSGRLESRDLVFVRMASLIGETGGTASVDRYMIQDLAKLIGIDLLYPEICRNLTDLASSEYWVEDTVVIDSICNGASQATQGSRLAVRTRAAQAILKTLGRGTDSRGSRGGAQKLLSGQPPLPTILSEEVLAYREIRSELPRVASLLRKGLVGTTPDEAKWKRLAIEALERLPEDRRRSIRLALEARREVALLLLDRRKFAKLHSLVYGWPDLAERLRVDGLTGLKGLEDAALGGGDRSIPDAWKPWLADERLLRLLRLPPLLGDIFDQELRRFLSVVDVLPSEAVGAKEEATEPPPPTVSIAEAPYEDVEVHLARVEGKEDKFSVVVRAVERMDESERTEIEVPFERIWLRLRDFLQASYPEVSREIVPPASVDLRFFTDQAAGPWQNMIELGTELYETFFMNDGGKLLLGAAEGAARIRVVLRVDDARIMALPWESVYLPPLEVFPSCSLKFSWVRFLSESRSLLPRPWIPPLKMLVLLSSPSDLVPLEIEQEAKILERALAAAVEEGHVEMRMLHGPTLSALQSALRTFEPHVFHFVGHGIVDRRGGGGGLVLENEEGRGEVVPARELGVMLQDFNIQLAVLNGCETGISGETDIMAGVAGAIVKEGAPAVVATLRQIPDSAALTFSQEFYRSMADGYPIEGAVVEARKALSMRNWDWSAYALFSGVRGLDSLRLIRRRSRNQGSKASATAMSA